MTPNVNLYGSSGDELGDSELNLVVGADWGGASRYGEAWARHEASAAPTLDQWKAWGQQLAAAYQANHSTHLGSPLK
jgi:hypothetical protein